jgi:putative endonuclease
MSSPNKNSIYIGVTNDLQIRVKQHKTKFTEGFTSKYNCIHLVYFESFNDINIAIKREKQLKKWNREWKNEIIIAENSNWEDLAELW